MTETDPALAALQNALDNAEVATDAAAEPEHLEPGSDGGEVPPPPDYPEGPDGGGGHKPFELELPPECPVVPLGRRGTKFYYLNPAHEIVELSARDHSHNHMVAMFSPHDHILEEWVPRRKQRKIVDEAGKDVLDLDTGKPAKEWYTDGFHTENAMRALMRACAREGVWSGDDRVRGVGAWADVDGRLIYHCGDKLWTEDGDVLKPGKYQGFIYAGDTPQPMPYDEPIPSDETSPMLELKDLLHTWHWQRSDGDVDVRLMLGWIGAAMVGGALDWRPMVFLTGDKGTGKSTLQKVIKWLFHNGVIDVADTTGAGIYQRVRQSTLPVAIDELEAQADNSRTTAVIRLARLASSGGKMSRGSSGGQSVEFQARSCFMFSAVLPPPLEPQDRSRMAMLRLKPLKGRTSPVQDPGYFRDLGVKIKRRMADQWHRYRETLQLYMGALAKAGHDNRGCEQFGSLLACHDLMMYEELPDKNMLADLLQFFDVKTFREVSDTTTDAENCLQWLSQAQPETFKGGARTSVAALVGEITKPNYTEENARPAREALAAAGLAVVRSRKTGVHFLAVPVSHMKVADLFRGSNWVGNAGTSGGWVESLLRLEDVLPHKVSSIAGRSTRCLWVPVGLVTQNTLGVDEHTGAGPVDVRPGEA